MKGIEIVDTLQVFGEIAHWTVRPDFDLGNLSYPPIITWRYKEPSNAAADFFQGVVSAYRGAISWDFSVAHPTWVLMPLRVREYANAHEGLGGLGAAGELMRTDPEFGKRANADLGLLLEDMQRQLTNAGSRNGLKGIVEEKVTISGEMADFVP